MEEANSVVAEVEAEEDACSPFPFEKQNKSRGHSTQGTLQYDK